MSIGACFRYNSYMFKLILAVYVVAATFALVTLKLGTEKGLPVVISGGRLHFNLNFYFLLGLALYVVSFLAYMYLVSKNDLGYIIPFAASLVYILLFTASYFVFNETFTALKIFAIILIMTGGVLINIHK